MLKKNNIATGLLVGAVVPLLMWLLFQYPLKHIVIMNKPAIPYLVAVTINLFIIRYSYNKGAEQTARGIMIITFIFMLLIFLLKSRIAS